MIELSIIIPVYKNEQNLIPTYTKLKLDVLDKISNYELIFVDDGSPDNSYNVMSKLSKQDSRIKLIKLSRNFGQGEAIFAGLRYASGNCAVFMSADLQDPPQLINEMLLKWHEGFKVVMAVRKNRQEGVLQKILSNTYYHILRKIALKNYPQRGFDFCLLDRKVLTAIINMEERNTTILGLIVWAGFNTAQIGYTRQSRQIGKSSWTFSKKFKLFMDAILSFSYFPIKVISICGIIDCIVSLAFIIYLVIQRISYHGPIAGWSSIMVAIMFTSGVQMLTLGIIGEYLWRNYDAARKRPLYLIDEIHGFHEKN